MVNADNACIYWFVEQICQLPGGNHCRGFWRKERGGRFPSF